VEVDIADMLSYIEQIVVSVKCAATKSCERLRAGRYMESDRLRGSGFRVIKSV
jgi:hypothetical protein